jgi:hypothetical protein
VQESLALVSRGMTPELSKLIGEKANANAKSTKNAQAKVGNA